LGINTKKRNNKAKEQKSIKENSERERERERESWEQERVSLSLYMREIKQRNIERRHSLGVSLYTLDRYKSTIDDKLLDRISSHSLRNLLKIHSVWFQTNFVAFSSE
jgi:hypothetical protein